MIIAKTERMEQRTQRVSSAGAAQAATLLEGLLGKTPYGNTGSNSHLPPKKAPLLSVKIDWITVMVPLSDDDFISKLLNRVSSDFNCDFESFPDKGRYIGRQFHHHARGSRGSLIAWNLAGESDDDLNGSCRISLNAQTIDGADQLISCLFIYDVVHTWDGHCSRCDIAIDDHNKSVAPWDVLQAYSDGNYGRFRSMGLASSMKLGQSEGWTIYMGSRQSESMLRYYDKDAESDGKVESYRWEVELKGQKAAEFAANLCAIPSSELPELLPKYLGAIVFGQIEFIHRESGDKNLGRCERLCWWQALIDAAGGALRISTQRAKPTIQRSIDHMVRCSGMFVTVLDSLTGPLHERYFIDSLKREGKRRQKDNHLRILEDAKKLLRVGITPQYSCATN